MSRKPPCIPQQPRLNRSKLPQAFLTNKREEKELEKKLMALKLDEEKKLTKRSTKQVQQQREIQTRSGQRIRPKHGDNKWRRNLALSRFPTPPENSLSNISRSEVRRSSCDFQLSGSSDSSQEEDGITSATTTMTLHPASTSTSRVTSPHPHFASSSTNCSPIYRRRTIPTILVTDTDRRRLSPHILGNHDYMERVQVLSHSMPTLFSNENKHKAPESDREYVSGYPSSDLSRSRPGTGRSSVVKLPPISPCPHPLMASHNSTKEKDMHMTGLRTTLLM